MLVLEGLLFVLLLFFNKEWKVERIEKELRTLVLEDHFLNKKKASIVKSANVKGSSVFLINK